MGTLVGSVVSICSSGLFFKVNGGKRRAFKKKRNKSRVGQDRNVKERQFLIDGAAKEKERRPYADRISGTVSRSLPRDLKFRVGT